MKPSENLSDGPVVRAAKKALETGNANYILIWIPEGSENSLRNLLERASCACHIDKDVNTGAIDWYFTTVNRFHSLNSGPDHLDLSTKKPEEKTIIILAERACESGNFDEITTVVRNASWGEMRQRFSDLLKMREYDVDNTAAGRAYASAFTAFVAQLNRLHSGSRREAER